MSVTNLAICVDGLSENWLGGVNYFRNLLTVFDAAANTGLRLHLLTDDPGFLSDLRFSDCVQVHTLPMLRRKSAAWAVRKTLQLATGRDVQLLHQLKQLQVRAVVFSYVAGAASARIRCVPWIPDFQFIHHPELFPPAVVAAEKQRAEKFLRHTDGLVVSSKAAGDDAVARFGANPDRLHVLHFAPKIDFEPLQSSDLRDEVFAAHAITRPYVFLPNQYWQHKNHRLVAEALRLLKQAGSAAPLIVSTGKTDDLRNSAYFSEFENLVRQEGLVDDYRILGVIPRQHMLVLLAHSAAVLNPSRFEGWSTTVEEAKALGKPLLVSDIAVHREQVAGVADAERFGTDDAAALAALLSALQQRDGARSVTDFAPRPDPGLYTAFSRQYLALLHSMASAPVLST